MKVLKEHCDDVRKYVNEILEKKVVSCKYIFQACERFQKMLTDSQNKDTPYVFSTEKALQIFKFIDHYELRFVQDKWGGDKIELQPFQKFIIFNLYGWRHRSDLSRRYTTDAIIFIPKKSGKTTLASIIRFV